MNVIGNSGGGDNSWLVGAVAVLAVLGYAGYHIYLFFWQPDQWAEMQRRKHEREMAAAEERKAKEKAAANGLLGGIVKGVIEAAFKKR